MPSPARVGFWLFGSRSRSGVLAAASGWTKFASLIVAPLWLTYPTRPRRTALPRRLRSRRTLARLLDPVSSTAPAARGRDVLAPHVRLPVRPRRAVVALGLAAVPRQRPARPHWSSSVLQGCCSSRRDSRRVAGRAEVAAPARRVHRGAARGLRDGADVLALHVHPVVLPVRRDRDARAGRWTAEPRRSRASAAGR